MEQRIKLIWDFRGPQAQHTAAHHKKHLEEYALAEALTTPITGTAVINESHHIAFLVVNPEEMKPVRDALKPHRGQHYQ